jgi:hypothetical protein
MFLIVQTVYLRFIEEGRDELEKRISEGNQSYRDMVFSRIQYETQLKKELEKERQKNAKNQSYIDAIVSSQLGEFFSLETERA